MRLAIAELRTCILLSFAWTERAVFFAVLHTLASAQTAMSPTTSILIFHWLAWPTDCLWA